MELNYENLTETLEFFRRDLPCYESYLKYLADQEESDYIRTVAQSYKVAIQILEERLMCEIMCGEVDDNDQ